MPTSLLVNEESREVCIKAKSFPVLLAFIGQVTERMSVVSPTGRLSYFKGPSLHFKPIQNHSNTLDRMLNSFDISKCFMGHGCFMFQVWWLHAVALKVAYIVALPFEL